jgi:hypothetical protein
MSARNKGSPPEIWIAAPGRNLSIHRFDASKSVISHGTVPRFLGDHSGVLLFDTQ